MVQLSLIGSAHLEEDILLENEFQYGARNQSSISIGYGGTIRNVAHNLAVMGIPSSFCTKLGNDDDAVRMWGALQDLGVKVYGTTIDQPTPKKTVIYPIDGKETVFWNRTEEFLFHKGDTLPYPIINKSDICLTDVKDDGLLLEMVTRAPDTKWILSHHIPDKSVLSCLWGLVISYPDALTLGKPSDFKRICYRLCSLGPKWILINMDFQGIYVFTNQEGRHFGTKCSGKGYPNGCYSAFLSGLTAGLAVGSNLKSAVNAGLTAQSICYNSPQLINPEVRSILRRK